MAVQLKADTARLARPSTQKTTTPAAQTATAKTTTTHLTTSTTKPNATANASATANAKANATQAEQAHWEGRVGQGAVLAEKPSASTPLHPSQLASSIEKTKGAAFLPSERVAINAAEWKATNHARAKDGVFAVELGDGKGAPGFAIKTSTADATGTVHTADELVDKFVELHFGRKMLESESWRVPSTSIGFVDDKDWPAFERFYNERAMGMPKLDGAAFPLWVKDQSDVGGHVMFVVPAQAAAKPADVLVDMRNAMGIREIDGDLVGTDLAVARAEAELKGTPSLDVLHGVFDLLTKSDVRDARVNKLLDDVEQRIVGARDQRIGEFKAAAKRDPSLLDPKNAQDAKLSATGNMILNRDLFAAVAGNDRKTLVKMLAADAGELHSARDLAARKLRAKDAVAGGGDWFASLKKAARDEVAMAAPGMRTSLTHDWKNIPPETNEKLEKVMKRAVDTKAFASWLDGFMQKVGDRMSTSKDPFVRERWSRHEMDPQVVREVAWEEAKRVGFGGVHTIPAGAGYVPPPEFWKPLAGGKLIDDPYFALDTGVIGLHGRDMHVLQWIFLADGEPSAPSCYSEIIDAYNKDVDNMLGKERDPFYWLFDTPSLGRSLMSPPEFTRLTAPFLGNQ
jgi:hypothetical protein